MSAFFVKCPPVYKIHLRTDRAWRYLLASYMNGCSYAPWEMRHFSQFYKVFLDQLSILLSLTSALG